MAGTARRGAAGAVKLVQAFDPITGGTLWVALSRSHPDLAYILAPAADGRWLCGCPRFRFRSMCPHVEAVYALADPRRYADAEKTGTR